MESVRHSCRVGRNAYLVAGLYEAVLEGKPHVLLGGRDVTPTLSEGEGEGAFSSARLRPLGRYAPSGLTIRSDLQSRSGSANAT